MDIFQLFRSRIENAIVSLNLIPEGIDAGLSRLTVEAPRETAHGDVSTNAALLLAKPASLSPRAIADQLVAVLAKDPDVDRADVAGPGFVNLSLSKAFWQNQLSMIVEAGQNYGRNSVAAPRAINVEYVSANPTGPMHVGHCRGAVVGDALANLLSFAGHKVTKEYYINDAGGQVDVLAQSALLRYREALGEDIGEIPAGYYPGDYLKPVGAALAQSYGDKLKTMHKDAA
ncbi:MAG: arginine--tRNA ligase, partial [Notoacmeibacter sp.]